MIIYECKHKDLIICKISVFENFQKNRVDLMQRSSDTIFYGPTYSNSNNLIYQYKIIFGGKLDYILLLFSARMTH